MGGAEEAAPPLTEILRKLKSYCILLLIILIIKFINGLRKTLQKF